MSSTLLPWKDPLELIAVTESLDHVALLYSNAEAAEHACLSYLCIGAREVCLGSDLEKLKTNISTDQAWYENFWVGWLGYGLKNQLEKLPSDTPNSIPTEDFYFFKPKTIYHFNHNTKQIECYGEHSLEGAWHKPKNPHPACGGGKGGALINTLNSNMTQNEYLEHVETILDKIKAGTLYQANLTRKFFGEFSEPVNDSALFVELCQKSPAVYSALIRAGKTSVLSSSPELFLQIETDQTIHTRPIKGTIGRGSNNSEDQKNKQALAGSIKDKAENLMIVDLMRNDLSRSCIPGSVKVDALFDISTHAHIHHMSSVIRGELSPGTHPLDAAMQCFPPGSMTGAPKIKAMEVCSALERQARGVYSGALGFFSGDGTAHFSVVIRTLMLQSKQFEFQVGGGIVADSIPEMEYKETLQKAKGICAALGISIAELEAL